MPSNQPPRNSYEFLNIGRIFYTPRALKALEDHDVELTTILWRHATGDWGEISASDRALNDTALERGERTYSAYQLGINCKVWVITECDCSSTTVVMPDEYL